MHPALADFLAHRGDPLAAVRAAPRSAQSRIIEASLLLCSRYPRDFAQAGRVYVQLKDLELTAEEERHLRAIGAAVQGDYAGAARIYDEILARAPQRRARARGGASVRLLPGRSAISACAHYPGGEGLEIRHAGIPRGAVAARVSRSRNAATTRPPRTRRSVPSRCSPGMCARTMRWRMCIEMQGRFEEGIRWMGRRSGLWSAAGVASTHLWWHIALYHLELGRLAHALAIYDHRIQGGALSELIDASALLWRLHLGGADVASRCRALAARWAPHAEDGHCAFNDLHAMMAFVAGGRADCATRLLATLERRLAAPWGANHDMTRLVGLPACRALEAYGRGDFDAAERLLRGLPPVAHRIGGSHAQRDVLHLTRSAAALRRVARSFLRAA